MRQTWWPALLLFLLGLWVGFKLGGEAAFPFIDRGAHGPAAEKARALFETSRKLLQEELDKGGR